MSELLGTSRPFKSYFTSLIAFKDAGISLEYHILNEKMKYFFILWIIGAAAAGCSPKLAPDATWARQRWVVTEMKGVPVQLSGGRRDAFIEFRTTEKRFTGNGGCNQINGTYSVEKRELRFSEVTSTKMSCEDIAFETTFLDLLSKVDRFEQTEARLELKKKRETLLVLDSR